jgi:hypothetical protein
MDPQSIEIILTSQQRAKHKYYMKMKSDPKYIENRKRATSKYYNAHKHEYKYKPEPLLEIIV